ncbi:uncharacterized protein LOC126446885 [Schistocerca serialis cubense]|uniref:uncharacterized protein LOC126446885 n=1 Tax=Schistocerca serialis cubense TaxID=2023355 RepID=UPI00214E49D3|nr:uncharacterized protein LOC126446885 [Schistocerca serialis cubense]
MDARRVEIVSADELSESDTLENMSDSQMNIELNSEDVQDIILPDRLRQQPLYLNRYTGEWRVSTTRQNATLTTSTSGPDINQTQKNDETKTQDSDMLNQILKLLGDQKRKFDALDNHLKRDIGKFDTTFDELIWDIKQNFEKQSRQIADLTETTSSLGRKFADLSDKATRQEKVFMGFSDETKTDLQRSTQFHKNKPRTLRPDNYRPFIQLNDVTFEQKFLQEKLEKLEDRADVASLKNDTTLAEKLVHECKLYDDYLDEKFETMTQIILDKTKEPVKGETDNIQKEVRKLKENVIPSLSVIPKPLTGNQNSNENPNNARPSTRPKTGLPMSDTNPNEPFSMLPQDQNYYQTSPHTMHSLTQNAGPVIPDEIRNFNQLYPIHPRNSSTHNNRNNRGYWNPPPTPQQNSQRNNSHYTGTNPFNIRRNNSQHWQGNGNYYYNGYPNSNYNQNNNSYIQNNKNRTRNRNHRDQRREDNRYHPGYFQRNNTQQHPNMYCRKNSNDNTSYSHGRNNVWGNHNGPPPRHVQYSNHQFLPNGTPNATRVNVNNQTVDTWVTRDRNVNIIELSNDPNPQQQPNLLENERQPS